MGSEAAGLPGRAGLLSREECCHATPHPPREVRTKLFSPPFYSWLFSQPCRCFKMKRGLPCRCFAPLRLSPRLLSWTSLASLLGSVKMADGPHRPCYLLRIS